MSDQKGKTNNNTNLTASGGRKYFEMQVQLFNVPITDNGEMLSALNHFLASNKVLEVEQKFFQNEKGASWCFCVRYLQGVNFSNNVPQNKKVDYKQELSESEFIVFSKLRECRKIIAANDAVPAYAVFTDEELAGIARLPEIEVSKLISIKGIGDKKVEKYGHLLIEMLNSKLSEKDEKNG